MRWTVPFPMFPADHLVPMARAAEANGFAWLGAQVDELLGKQEVVIKNLGDLFVSQRDFAGAAILGDGRVGLILDVNTLVKLRLRGGEAA